MERRAKIALGTSFKGFNWADQMTSVVSGFRLRLLSLDAAFRSSVKADVGAFLPLNRPH